MESRQLRSAGPIRDDRVDILGVGVSPINLDDAIATIERWISEGSRNYVCITGVHGVMESRRNQRLRRIHNEAGMVTPDGVPLVWLSRLLGKHRTERVYGPDLMRKMTAVSSQRGFRQFYYGGAEGVADKLKQVLVNAHPALEVAGAVCPPFRELTPEEDQAGWSGCFGCARNRGACGAAMPTSCPASSFSLSVISRAAPSGAPRKRPQGRHLANRLPGMSMHRDGHPWTARRTIAVSLPRSHDGESRSPPSTPNVVGFDHAPQGTGETLRGKEERWTTI